MEMKTLNANKLFEMDFLSHYSLCFHLLIAVSQGAEVLRLSEQDKEYGWINEDGERRSFFPGEDEAFWSCMRDNVTAAIADFTSQLNDFTLSIGDNRLRVAVEGMASDSPRTIMMRIHGAKQAREQARTLLDEMINDEKRGSMILSYDGRILGHGTLKLKYRIAEVMQWVFIFAWYAGWIGLVCVAYGFSPLAPVVGAIGWLPCVLLGILLAMVMAPYVFARYEIE